MEKEDVLKVAQSKKAVVGEMEKSKFFVSSNIALLCVGVLAVAFIILEFALKNFGAGFAISSLCYLWASVFYTCQFFIAKRPWQVLIGSVLHGIAFVACIVLFILSIVKGW